MALGIFSRFWKMFRW